MIVSLINTLRLRVRDLSTLRLEYLVLTYLIPDEYSVELNREKNQHYN